MGMAEFLEKRFLGERICIYTGEDMETITYSEAWASNKEYFQGLLLQVSDGVLELEIEGQGSVYIGADHVKFVWQLPFEYAKAVKASLTRRPVAGRR